MPNKANAWKALRQSKRRHTRNERHHAGIEYLRRAYVKALASKQATQATAAFRMLQKALDRAAQKGVLKDNTAARLTSRAAAKLKAIAS